MRNVLVLVPIAIVISVSSVAAQNPNVTAASCNIADNPETYDRRDREAACLREFGTRARRMGNVLSLKLDDGRTKIFRNDPCPEEEDTENKKCVDYYLVGFHPVSRRYMVHASLYQGYECQLVSARTGNVTTLPNTPIFAPDGTTFFVDWYDASHAQWIAIGSVASDPPSLNWKTGPLPNQSWILLRWISNSQIALRDATRTDNRGATIKRTNSVWALERLP